MCDDLPAPGPAPGESRVRVLAAGVCATDLALARGYMNFRGVPGHEFVGEALEGKYAGQRVVGEINACCGDCAECRRGLERHCSRRTVLGIAGRPGAFAEELRLPTANLHPVPAGLATNLATFTEPVAAALEIGEQVDLGRMETALVLGDGRLGLLCAQVLQRAGPRVQVLGRHPERARWLRGIPWMGAEEDTRFDLVVEATGKPELISEALKRVRPRGTVVLKTTSEAASSLDLAPLVIDEITLVGSRCGPFAPALRALAAGEMIVEPMIDAHFPLERAVEALAEAGRPGVLKVLIHPVP
jgi:threonine dehydrogenase-like Zn-dependent dehydrogenase